MIPVRQTILDTERGNCFAACLASLLEVDCDHVPNIHDFGVDWFYPLNAWLAANFNLVLLMIEADAYAHKVWFPDGVPFIASCNTRDEIRHAVVMEYRGMEAITLHDPYPLQSGVSGGDIVFMYFLCKAN